MAAVKTSKVTKADLELHIDNLNVEIEDLKNKVETEIEKAEAVREEIRSFAKNAYDRYPDVCEALDSIANNEMYNFCSVQDSVIMAVVPRGALRARYNALTKKLEFEHNDLGVRYWAGPLDGDFNESDVA